MAKQAIVIGAGPGGLSAAIHLRLSGFEVSIFEQNVRPGGKMNQFAAGGYRFDTGPSLLTLPSVIDALFTRAGLERNDFLEFELVEPICRYFWDDGQRLDAGKDVEAMKAELARISPADAENYADFLRYAGRIYDMTADIFLHTPIHEVRKLLTRENIPAFLRLLKIDPLRTMHQGIGRFFKHPHIVQLFDRYATYNGSDPFKAPATLNVIPYVEHGLGGYYIKGGMYRLVEALSELALSLGVKLHLSAPAEKIFHQDRKLRGVVVNGDFIPADYLVCNADVVTAHNQLIDGFPEMRKKLNRLEPSISGLVFLWGVKKRHEQLTHHNILFSRDYRREFTQIFDRREAPDDPTVYIAITSKSNPEHAPAGGENWFVLLNMPYLKDGQDWDEITSQMRERVLAKLKQVGIDIRDQIEIEQTYTPADFYNHYGSNRGSIYGISSNRRSTAFRRPANRSRLIKGLYFAGGASHPGGGIPLVLLSGKMAAELIAEDAGVVITKQQTRHRVTEITEN